MNTADRPAAWARSLPTPEAVLALVEDHFPIRPRSAVLVRSFVNDVYRIQTTDRSYALKIYGVGRFTADGVRWEQDLARHLVGAGVQVAADVPTRTGDSIGILDCPEGSRPFAMTEWLPGAKPEPPWTDDLYRRVGSGLARLHAAADSFVSDHPRSSIRIGDEPAQVIAVLDDQPARRALVQRAATAAEEALIALADRGLRRGVRHGDPSLDNLHVVKGEIHFYDLDLAAPGWQVEDLTGALSTDFADPFLDGYTSIRRLPAVELEALPWLGILATIDNLQFHLISKPAMQGTASLAEGWVDRGFDSLVSAARALGLRT